MTEEERITNLPRFNPKPHKVAHAELIHNLTAEYGGLSIGPQPGDQPIEVGETGPGGYMVGGSANPATGRRVPELRSPAANRNLSVQQAMSTMAAVKASRLAGNRISHVGGWVPDDEEVHVYDSSDHIMDRTTAVSEGKRRNEDAVFDVKAEKDIKLK